MVDDKHPHTTRKYMGPTQFFHNFEHDPSGRTHCKGPPSNPYRITHTNGKNVINKKSATGHGKGNETQRFEFTEKVKGGWLLSSGEKTDVIRKLARKKLNEQNTS